MKERMHHDDLRALMAASIRAASHELTTTEALEIADEVLLQVACTPYLHAAVHDVH